MHSFSMLLAYRQPLTVRSAGTMNTQVNHQCICSRKPTITSMSFINRFAPVRNIIIMEFKFTCGIYSDYSLWFCMYRHFAIRQASIQKYYKIALSTIDSTSSQLLIHAVYVVLTKTTPRFEIITLCRNSNVIGLL